jgi:integrase
MYQTLQGLYGGLAVRKYLTQKVCERAKPKDKPYEITDTAITGFILRVQPLKPSHPPGGLKIFKLITNGRPETLGRMPVMTCGMARAEVERRLRGDEEGETPPAPMTLDDFIEEHYGPYVRANHAQPDETLARVRRFNFGDKHLDEIKLADVETWRIKRQKLGRNPTTINRDTSALKAALQRAVDWELIEAHPLARLKPLKVDRRKVVRYLKPAEEKRLVAALVARDEKKRRERESANEWRKVRGYDLKPSIGIYADNLTPMVLLAINTGLRRGELWNLTWGDVDLRRKMLTVHGKGAKSGQTRHIPLNAAAVDTLKNHRGDVRPLPSIPVFGRATFRKSWGKLLKDAKIENFRFHDCRHHFASKLVMAGVPLNTVRELMGHSSLEMTLIYAHLAPENLRAAVELI